MKNVNTQIQEIINQFKSNNKQIYVLEAGCGSLSRFDFDENYHITGIDISSKQLERNKNVNEKILGDIQYFSLGNEKYDIIMCVHVLEHLIKPELALINFFNSIKKNGIIIISSPNPLSLKGLVTKFTPHWFHIFVYRNIYRIPNAGTEETAPFRVYMKFKMSKNSLISQAISNGLRCEINHSVDALDANSWVADSFRKKSPLLFYILVFLVKSLKIITFGIIGDSDYTLVLKKV